MKNILYLVPYFPYPPNHGGKAVIYHKIRALSKYYQIHLVCPRQGDHEEADSTYPDLASLCASVHSYKPDVQLPPPGKMRFLRELMLSVRRLVPSAAALFCARSLPLLLESIVRRKKIDLIALEHSYAYALLLDSHGQEIELLRALPVVICEQNVEHIILRDAARDPITRWPIRLMRRWEQIKTYFFTRRVYRRAQGVSYLAPTDLEVFQRLGWNSNLFLTPPIIPAASRRHVVGPGNGTVLFTSSLGYFPNQAGLTWFYRTVWPLIRQRTPQARLCVTGHPTERLRALLRNDLSVEMTGFLTEAALEDRLIGGDVAIAPIWLGSGIKIKIIMALSYGLPLVGTSKSLAGVEAMPGRDVIVADDPESFAKQVVELLVDENRRRQLSENAHQAFVKTYDPNNAIIPWRKFFDVFLQRTNIPENFSASKL